jgi:transcriptional regulator with XRE-family HTH domain
MTKIRELLAANIRKYRHARGWSQAKLAEKVDTSAHYIGMLETRSKYPSPEMVERIAAAFSIDSTDLFRRDADPGETVNTLRKAILADIGGVVGNFIEAQIRGLDADTALKAPPDGENSRL